MKNFKASTGYSYRVKHQTRVKSITTGIAIRLTDLTTHILEPILSSTNEKEIKLSY